MLDLVNLTYFGTSTTTGLVAAPQTSQQSATSQPGGNTGSAARRIESLTNSSNRQERADTTAANGLNAQGRSEG